MWRVLKFVFIYIASSLAKNKDIRMQRDFYTCPVFSSFNVYWNVPTFLCSKHGFNFSQHTQKWGILSNSDDQFRGSVINILYDPGSFPAMLESSATGKLLERNGGIPQDGNITMHLEAFQNVVNQLIPKDFDGPAIIDFEAYRPIWRQNWGKQTIYQNMSRDEVRQRHPQATEEEVDRMAATNFEAASKVFFQYTIDLAKLLRPKAKWGYYGFPYCYNFRQNTGMLPSCDTIVQTENNRLQWLFEKSGALYPSIYMTHRLKDTLDQKRFVLGRINEGVRMACRARSRSTPHVYPYLWYKYYDSIDFLSSGDLYQAIETVRKYKMGGMVIWGATNDVTSKEKCQDLLDYLTNTLGPTIQVIRNQARNMPDDIPQLVNLEHFSLDESSLKISYPEEKSTPKAPIYITARSLKDDTKKTKKCSSKEKCKSKSENLPILNAYIKWYDRVMRAILNLA